jgi:hypothetical protein
VKRLFWALTGIGLGAAVGLAGVRWVSKTKKKYAPPAIAKAAGGKMAQLRERLKEAVAAGAEEMMVREAELRAELDLPPG